MKSIAAPNVSIAWAQAVEHLLASGGRCFNLVASIADPNQIDERIHTEYEQLLSAHHLLAVKQVIYTVFPCSLYEHTNGDAEKLFDRYNRPGGVYERLKLRYVRKFGWGSYFRRMTHYEAVDAGGHHIVKNQLRDIIGMMRQRDRVHSASYTILIQAPGTDGRRVRGGPCLNYIALQLAQPRVMGMLAVYRSHDFVQRAYANYMSLGRLMKFIGDQTGYSLGELTCVSSYASISDLGGHSSWPSAGELRRLVGTRRQ